MAFIKRRKPYQYRWIFSLCFLAALATIFDVRDLLVPLSHEHTIDVENQSSESVILTRIKIHTGYPQQWRFPVEPSDQAPLVSSYVDSADSGRHACTCLDSANTQSPLPQMAQKNDGDFNFRWLHIPKTGTSLIITLWIHATSFNDRNVPQAVDTNIAPYFKPGCNLCFDFAFMQRYPLELFAHDMHLRRPFGEFGKC